MSISDLIPDDVKKLASDYGTGVTNALTNEAQTLLHVAMPVTGFIQDGSQNGGNFLMTDVFNQVKTTAHDASNVFHDVVNIVNPKK